MLAPHELKNKEFTKSLRGYSTVEVDEHIDFIIEKYTELYRQNDELEKKLRLCESQLDSIKGEEDAIRSALINAQKASTRIIAEANERADVIMNSAKNSCERHLEQFRDKIREENEKLLSIKKEIALFKEVLFAEYKKHIELVSAIAEDKGGTSDPSSELAEKVLADIKASVQGKGDIISGSKTPYSDEHDDTEDKITPHVKKKVSAEENIPDDLFKSKDKTASPVRDSDVNDGDEDISDGEGKSVVDSIKMLNRSVKDTEGDDEEFLQMLEKMSADEEDDDDDSDVDVSTTEFGIVYDGKK